MWHFLKQKFIFLIITKTDLESWNCSCNGSYIWLHVRHRGRHHTCYFSGLFDRDQSMDCRLKQRNARHHKCLIPAMDDVWGLNVYIVGYVFVCRWFTWRDGGNTLLTRRLSGEVQPPYPSQISRSNLVLTLEGTFRKKKTETLQKRLRESVTTTMYFLYRIILEYQTRHMFA